MPAKNYKGQTYNFQTAALKVIQAGQTVDIGHIRQALEISGPTELRQLETAIKELLRNGSIQTITEIKYKFVTAANSREKTVLNKIWKAMRVSNDFSKKDIHLLTGADIYYIGKFIAWLKKNDFLMQIGKKPWPGQTAKVAVYKVKSEYKNKLTPPDFNQRDRQCKKSTGRN